MKMKLRPAWAIKKADVLTKWRDRQGVFAFDNGFCQFVIFHCDEPIAIGNQMPYKIEKEKSEIRAAFLLNEEEVVEKRKKCQPWNAIWTFGFYDRSVQAFLIRIEEEHLQIVLKNEAYFKYLTPEQRENIRQAISGEVAV